MANINLIPFVPTGLTYIGSIASLIEAAASEYGISAAAIAGAIALEQNNAVQFSSTYAIANVAVGADLAILGLSSNPSQEIAQDEAAALASGTTNPTYSQKAENPVYLDMGPAKIRLELAIQLVTDDPDDPVFAPYVNNFYQLAQDLSSGSNPTLTASLIGAYMQQGVAFFETHLGPADDPQAGLDAWNALTPSYQNALLVQYYNQGPTFLTSAFNAANTAGQQWSPQLGDGGALYAVPGNETLLAGALAAGTADAQCFSADARILFGNGVEKSIGDIVIGDCVAAFDGSCVGDAPLRPARVMRVFRNITSEWLVLSCGLTVTPGHLFLNERGEFERIDALLARGGDVVLADGALQSVTAQRVGYSEATRHLYEEAEEIAVATAGALALAPQVARGWRTYNFEVEHVHTYIAGGVRVHNDSLGDLIVAEDEYQQIYGAAFDPSNSTDVQQLAADIANGTIDGGSLATSVGPSGDLTALEQRLVSDDDQITDIVTDANGNTTFTDSNGDQITLDPNRQEVSEVLPDGQGGSVTEIFGYSSNGTQVVATEQDVNAAGQTISSIVNTTDPATGALISSSETDYDSAGNETDAFTTDGNNNLTTYDQFDSDGSSTFYVYNGAGEVSSDTQYGANGGVVVQQQLTYDSSGDLSTITTQDGAGDPVSFDAYNPDGSHILTDFNSSDQPIEQTQYASDGQTVVSTETLAYDSSGDLSTVTTYDGSGDLVSVDDYLANGSQALSQYTSAGQLSTVTTTNSAGVVVSLDTYAADGSHVLQAYDGAGQLTSQTQYANDGQTIVSIQAFSYDASGGLAEIDTTDGAGDVLSTDVYQPGGSHQLTTYNADGTDTLSSFDASGALSMTQTFDVNGNLLSASGVSGLGVAWTETVDASGTSFTYGVQSVDYSDAAIDVGGAMGSALGKALGGNSLIAQIGYGTVLGTLGKVLASELADGTLPAVANSAADAFGAAIGGDLDSALNSAFGSFGVAMSQEFQTVGAGGLAGLLMLELANALGLKGFDAGLFDATGTTITSAFITNVLGAVTTGNLGPAAISDELFAGFDTAQFIGTLETSVTGFFGSYLAAQLIAPTNEDGSIGSSVGSSVGSVLGSLFLGPLGAFLGSFIGDVLGTLIGDLFGGSPEATADVAINGVGQAVVSDVSTENGGDATLVTSLATSTASTVNGLLAQAGAFVTGTSGSVTEYYQKNSTVMITQANAGVTDVAANSSTDTWSSVIDGASMAFLQNATISDNDVVMLTALGEALVRESGVVAVSSDLTIAQDYETYLANSDLINAVIEANPDSSFAAGWEVTLLEAEGLGLNNVTSEAGWTATLSKNVENIYDVNGGLVEEVVFNADGTQSIENFPITTINASGESVALSSNTAYEIVGADNTITLSANDHVYLSGTGGNAVNPGTNGDTVFFDKGDGQATLESDTGGALVFGSDIAPNDLTFGSDAQGDLIIGLKDASDSVTIQNELEEDASGTSITLPSIELSNGTMLTVYRAGAGTATVTAADGGGVMLAGEGDDTFDVGDVNDTGQTNIVYGSFNGDLTINAAVWWWNTLSNALQLSDLDASDVTFSRDQSNDLLITVNATGNTITVNGEFNSTDNNGVQSVQFADGTTWTWSQIEAAAWYRAGSGNVTLTAADGGGTMLAGAGDDTFNVGDLNDTGQTTIVYGSLDGDLTINAAVWWWNTLSNVLDLSDLNASDVTFSRDQSNDLLITVNATGNTITVNGEFNSTDNNGVQSVQFADGTVWDESQIEAAAWYRAGSGNVTLTAADGGGTMLAGAGDDTFNVGDLNDTGQTTIVYGSLDGDLTINAAVWWWNTLSNVLDLSDLNASDVTFSRDQSNDLLITVNATGNTITVNGEFNSTDNNGVQSVQFADGTVWDESQIEAAAWYRAGPGTVTLAAADGGGTMLAGAGDDTFNVGDLNDTGQTTIVYGSLDGDLTINAAVWWWNTLSNVLDLSDLNASDVTFARDQSNDLLITVNSTGNTITVNGEFNSTDNDGVQSVQFADGVVWTAQQIVDAANGAPPDHGPTAGAVAETIGHGQTVDLTPALLAAATPGVPGDTLSIADVNGAQGAVSIANGQVEYTAPNSGVSSDAFTYTVSDQLGDQATGDVDMTVDPGPTAGPVSASVDVGDSVDLTSDILAAATPGLPGDVLTITGDDAAGALGTIALVNGDLVYTASAAAFANLAANASATESFSYTIADQLGDVASGAVNVAVDNPVTAISGPAYGGTIQGVDGEEILTASGYSNVIDANGGSGVINAGQGSATVNADSGNLAVNLQGYTDSVSGGDGTDTISGSQGDATIALGNGDDQVTTGGYNNVIALGDGNDTVNAGLGNEVITLGNGNNNVTASGYNNVITVGNGANTIAAGAGDETITAGAGTNTIVAQGYDNTITLGAGSNTVSAGDGSDTVTANGGNDVLTFNSWNDYAILNASGRASIYDQGGGLTVDVAAPQMTIDIYGVSFDPQALIDLLNPSLGYSSVGGVMNALTSDGHGGTMLALGATGSIDFVNTAVAQLHASNFRIG